MDKKQTAVEFLGHELNVKLFYDISPELWEQVNEIFNQAKAIEKEQIIDSFDEGKSDGYKTAREWDEMIIWLSGEQYYNETYGQ